MRLRTTHGRLDRLLWCWKYQGWDHFFSKLRTRLKIFRQMTQCLVNICVVVYNVVVFSGEDIGGQMREMAIFGVPCWGLMVSGGVQGSNDRAGSYRGPTALVRACHPQHRQNLRSPRSRPLWQLELEQALFCGEHRFEVQLFSFWCHFKKQIWSLRLNLSENWSSRHDTPFII